jgi:glycosyltransferase involved in cell wall biosynthesis
MIKEPLSDLAFQIAHAHTPPTDKSVDISVIIPCFNAAEFLHICLESLKRQTLDHKRFEIICVDDCSRDGTFQVAEAYKAHFPHLHVLCHQKNRKQGAARNTGLKHAQGKYITFVDADDYLRNDALEVMLGSIECADVLIAQLVKVCFEGPYKQSTTQRCVKGELYAAGLDNSAGWFPVAMLIKRELLIQHNIVFREGVFFEDIDFNILVFLAAGSHKVIKDPVYYYVQRIDSTVNAMTTGKLADAVRAMKVVFDFLANRTMADRNLFAATAGRWLLLQATRIRQHSSSSEERNRLVHFFVNELRSCGILSLLAADLTKKIKMEVSAGGDSIVKIEKVIKQPDFVYTPWKVDFRESFHGNVVFYCEVDYHIRSVVPIARRLKKHGIKSLVVDASRSASFTANRPLTNAELATYGDVDIRAFDVSTTLPFSTDAAAFVFCNDLTYTKQLIAENFGFGVPTIGFYEGINDDWNLDRIMLRRPYRSVDHLLLPGIYQTAFYSDRNCQVVGLPNVRALLAEPPMFEGIRRAIINVNFTYGVLESRRCEYVNTAVEACKKVGLEYIITQHPADKADLSNHPLGKRSIYELLREGGILISRFSTTIMEALALGRPVVYHNPIDEKVPKFHEPLGAYGISRDAAQLAECLNRELRFVRSGGDIRRRASLFLHFHCNTGSPNDPVDLSADAIADIAKSAGERFSFKRGTRPHSLGRGALINGEKSATEKSSFLNSHVNPISNINQIHALERDGRYAEALELYEEAAKETPLTMYKLGVTRMKRKLGAG